MRVTILADTAYGRSADRRAGCLYGPRSSCSEQPAVSTDVRLRLSRVLDRRCPLIGPCTFILPEMKSLMRLAVRTAVPLAGPGARHDVLPAAIV